MEQVIILSAEQYFKKYAVDGIGKGADRWMIRRQLIDAFHKEIFGLVAIRSKMQFKDIPPEGDPIASRIARNVIHDTTRKWVKLCKMFDRYKETSGLLKEDDLRFDEDMEANDNVGNTQEMGEQAGETAETPNGGSDRPADESSEGYSAGTEGNPN